MDKIALNKTKNHAPPIRSVRDEIYSQPLPSQLPPAVCTPMVGSLSSVRGAAGKRKKECGQEFAIHKTQNHEDSHRLKVLYLFEMDTKNIYFFQKPPSDSTPDY